MASIRRNTVSYEEERRVAVLSVGSGLIAALSTASPTGGTWIDVVLLVSFGWFVTWSAASAPWWALLSGAGLAVFGAVDGALVWLAAGLAALAGATWIGSSGANKPLARSVVGAAVVQVLLRTEWNPFFLASAYLALGAVGIIVITGVRRRRRYLRKRVYITAAVLAGLGTIAIAGIVVAFGLAQSDARDGYSGMLEGLEFVQEGRVPEAAETLRRAGADLDSASTSLGGPFGQLARFVPGIAQNRDASTEVLARASDAAGAAADTLELVDLDQLTVSEGVIDVIAFSSLAAPLDALDATIVELDQALHDAQSPWLIAPFATRLDDAIRRADQVSHQSTATAAAARIAPAMLGADGPRRYFIAFVNTAEARGLAGLMGNWTEITIDDGRLEVTANGRTNDLQDASLRELELDMPEEYIDRYSYFGARASRGVALKYWSNVTMTPHMPSVGNAMSQMYEHVTGREVDGVFVIDAAGLADLIEITGPIDLADIDRRIDSSNAEAFLTLGQYEFAENEREDLLTTVTDATIANVLEGTLPPPQQMAPILAPAVLNGHISAWAVRPEEQALYELVGMDASLPVVETPGMDAIAVANNNASGNKIESFLERTIEYRPIVDQRTGGVTATLRVEFTNTAPSTGFTDYVIGNLVDAPTGTNRMLVDVYTKLGIKTARVDGVQPSSSRNPELGYNVYTVMIDVPAGETVVLEVELVGNVGAGRYQLAYRPQPLPNDDTLIIEAATTSGRRLIDFDGVLERRSVLDADGVRAWR